MRFEEIITTFIYIRYVFKYKPITKMKNFIYLGIAVLLFACNPQPIAKISGTIQNQAADEIVISNQLLDSSDTLKITDGAFIASLTVEQAGTYYLKNGKFGFMLYLKPGADITINFDIDQLKQGNYTSLELSGKEFEESKFALSLNEKHSAIMKDFRNTLMLPSDSFENLINTYHTSIISSIDSFKQTGVADQHFFDRIELIKNIEKSEKYMYYTMYHKRLAPQDSLPIPASFKTVGDDIALDNEALYKELNTYKYFVLKKYDAKMNQAIEDEELDVESAAAANKKFDYLTALAATQEIKDELGNQMISSYTYANDEVKEVYESRYAELIKNEEYIAEFKTLLAKLDALKPGNKAPTFAYTDINGELINSEDLKGKVIYIDVWATWCGPCMREIPHLKALEEELHNKDIAFVSISIDGDKDAWEKMVAKKELKGYQLFAEGEWKSDIITNYAIKGIPRFILIDKNGNLVNANADRPSSEEVIKKQLIELANS